VSPVQTYTGDVVSTNQIRYTLWLIEGYIIKKYAFSERINRIKVEGEDKWKTIIENAIFKNDVYHSVHTDEIFRHAGILHCSQRLDGGSVMIVFAVCLESPPMLL
jgi:hypothetical protein